MATTKHNNVIIGMKMVNTQDQSGTKENEETIVE